MQKKFICAHLWGIYPWVPIVQDMGRTIRDGLAHKIKACGPRHCSAYTARFLEGILKIEIDLIGYARYRVPYDVYHVTD